MDAKKIHKILSTLNNKLNYNLIDYCNEIVAFLEKTADNYSKINNFFTKEIYDDLMTNFIHNISNNTIYAKKIIDKKINLSDILKRENINDSWNKIMYKQEYNEKNKNYLPINPNFKCKYCGSKSGIQYSYQTRSADEPMTIFNICQSCRRISRN